MSEPTNTRPLSSQDYAAQIRARRMATRQAANQQPAASSQPPVQKPSPTQKPQHSPKQTQTSIEAEHNSPPTMNQEDKKDLFPHMEKPIMEETVLEWKAPLRPFKKQDRQYYFTIGVIVFLISLILFFAGQFLPIAVVISIAFLAYVLSSVPPETVTDKITTYGIRIGEDLFYWEEMGRFWFEEKYKIPVLHIEIARFPNRITLLLGDVKKDEMKEILSEVLINEKPKPTFFDKAAKWIQEKIPLDNNS